MLAHTGFMNVPHLHLMLTHAPIFISLVGICMLVVAIVRKSSELRAASYWLLIAAALLAIAVYVTGEASEEAIEHLAGVSKRFIEEHADAARISLIGSELLGILAALGLFVERRRSHLLRAVVGAVLVTGALEMLSFTYTANLGGQIRHTEIRPGATQALRAPSADRGEN